MRTRFAIAVLIWPMIQAVLFGLGMIGLLAAPLEDAALMAAVWWMVAGTCAVSVPLAWVLAPRLRLGKRPHRRSLTRPGA